MTERAPNESRITAVDDLRSSFLQVATEERAAQELSGRRWTGLRPVLVGGAALALVAGIATTALISTGSDDGNSASAPTGGELKELYAFDSLSQMMASSDAVIVGTVTDVREGRTVGGSAEDAEATAPEGESELEASGAIQFNDVNVTISETLIGGVDGNVTLEEEADPSLGLAAASAVEDHGIYFLHRKDDGSGAYRLVNSQGRFLETSDGGVLAANDEDEWSKSLEALSFPELVSTVKRAVPAVEAGEVKPAQPALPTK